MTIEERTAELMSLHKEQLARMVAESENQTPDADEAEPASKPVAKRVIKVLKNA